MEGKLSWTIAICLPLLCSSFKKADDESVKIVNSKNFDEKISADKFTLVLFFAPWQDSCDETHKVINKIANHFSDNDDIIVAKANIYGDGKLASRFDVEDYCKIKFFVKGSDVAERYDGEHSFTDLLRLIESRSRINHSRDFPKQSVIKLNDINFERIVKDPSKDVLVFFHTIWCIKCKNLTEVVKNVAENFKNEPNCLIAELDGEKFFESAVRSKVGMYPTFVFFSKSDKDGQVYLPGKYDENWSEYNITKFLNTRCDTERITGGYLDQTAGRIDELDVLTKYFMRNSHKRDKAIREAIQTIEKLPAYKKGNADYYVKIMKAIDLKGDSFLIDEIHRIQRLILGSVSMNKVDELTRRRNVLQQFQKSRRDEL